MIAFLLAVLATTPVQALGQAPIVAGNRVAARDKALTAALEQAVDQALAYVLEPDARMKAQAALRAQLLPKARSYVPNYRVLDEHEIEGDKFQVQIEAQVDTTALRRDAMAVAGSSGTTKPPTTGKPRVLVALLGPPAAAARRALEAHGFPEATAPETQPPTSDADAAQRAKNAGAGLVVVGSAETRSDGHIRGTDQEAAQARVELRMLDADGHAQARGAADARGFGSSGSNAAEQALEQAATQAAEQMTNELTAKFAATPSGGDPSGILIRVSGLPTMRDLEALEQTLAQQQGVSSVAPRRLGGGEVWITVRGRTAGGILAQTLRSQGLQVDVATDREVRVRVPRGTQ
jgi:hypothetical protein